MIYYFFPNKRAWLLSLRTHVIKGTRLNLVVFHSFLFCFQLKKRQDKKMDNATLILCRRRCFLFIHCACDKNRGNGSLALWNADFSSNYSELSDGSCPCKCFLSRYRLMITLIGVIAGKRITKMFIPMQTSILCWLKMKCKYWGAFCYRLIMIIIF